MNRFLTLVGNRSSTIFLTRSFGSTVSPSFFRSYMSSNSNNNNSDDNQNIKTISFRNTQDFDQAIDTTNQPQSSKSQIPSPSPSSSLNYRQQQQRDYRDKSANQYTKNRIVIDSVKENEVIVNRLKNFIKEEDEPLKIITLLQSYFFDSSVNYHRLVESDEILNFIAYEQPQKLTIDMLNMFLQFHCSIGDDYRVQYTCSMFAKHKLYPNMATHQLAYQYFIARNMTISLERFQRVDIIQFIMETLIRHPHQSNETFQLLANSLSTVSPRYMANLLLLNQCLDGKQDIFSFVSQAISGKNERQIDTISRYLIQLYLHFGAYRPALLTFLQLRSTHGISPSLKTVRVFYRYHLDLLNEAMQQQPNRPKTILRHQLCTLFWFEYSRSTISDKRSDTINSPNPTKVTEILDPLVAEILSSGNVAGEPTSEDQLLQQLLSRGMKKNQDDSAVVIKHLQHFNLSQNHLPHDDLIIQCVQTLQTVLTTEQYFKEFLPKVPPMFRDLFMQPLLLQQQLKNNVEFAVSQYLIPNEDLSILTESIVTWNGLIIGLLNAHNIELASKVMLALISKNPKMLRTETLRLYSDYIIENHLDPRQLVDNLEWEDLRIDNLKQKLFNCKMSALVYSGEYHHALEMFNSSVFQKDANSYLAATEIYIGKHQLKRLTFDQFKNELLPAINIPHLSHSSYQDYYASIFSVLKRHNMLTPEFVRKYIESENIHFIGHPINQKLLLLILNTLPTPMERIVLILRCSYPNNNFSKEILDIINKDCQAVKDKQIEATIQDLIRKQKEREQLEQLEQQTTKNIGHNKLSVSTLVNLSDKHYDKEFDVYQLTPIKSTPSCKISTSTISFIKRNFIDKNKK